MLGLRACATTLRWFNFEVVVVVVIVVIFMCAHVCVHMRVPVWQSAYVRLEGILENQFSPSILGSRDWIQVAYTGTSFYLPSHRANP